MIRVSGHDYLYATFIFLFVLPCIKEITFQLHKGVIFFAIFYSKLAFTKEPEVSLITNLNLV